MAWKLSNDFHLVDWSEIEAQQGEGLTAADKYKKIVSWAGKARATNPSVFDSLIEWLLNDAEWREDKLAENEQIIMQGVFARFKEQNARLRAYLKELEPSGVVNEPVFKALDDFDKMLSGGLSADEWRSNEAAVGMFVDFKTMRSPDIRLKIAGNKTGPHGTDSVDGLGYIGHLKNADAQVQWCLFMPDMVKHQQNGFKVDRFEYKHMPSMRFIGRECLHNPNDSTEIREKDIKIRESVFSVLNEIQEHKSDFHFDILFMHHYGRGVDVEPWHGFWGCFMKADTPVPEGFVHFDLTYDYMGDAGLPFQSKYAFATFSGDLDAMHQTEGYDSDAMYDVTRNIILGQGIGIPYPEKYWTAEVFLDGYGKPGTAYMFSVVYD